MDVSGEREAENKFALARELRTEGLMLLSVEELGNKKSRLGTISFFNRVSLKDKIMFANNLGSMITAGLTLSRALNIMQRQSANKYFKKVLTTIEEKINRGDSLHAAMEGASDVFPPVFTAMVAAGEESGKLPQSLKIIGSQLSKTYELRRKVRGAMIYPAIIITLIMIIGVLMMVFLVPTLTETFKDLNVALPLSTRMVIFVSDSLTNHIFLFLILIIGAIVGGVFAVRTAVGQRFFDWFFLRLPVIGLLVKETNSAVMMRTIASLVTAGVGMVESLQITERVLQNSYYKATIKRAIDGVQKGVGLSVVFKEEEKLYPVLVGEMAEVGEETGNLADMLTQGAIFYEEEVDQATKNLSTIIEPFLMVIIGIAVGFFAISMIGPMYSLSNVI